MVHDKVEQHRRKRNNTSRRPQLGGLATLKEDPTRAIRVETLDIVTEVDLNPASSQQLENGCVTHRVKSLAHVKDGHGERTPRTFTNGSSSLDPPSPVVYVESSRPPRNTTQQRGLPVVRSPRTSTTGSSSLDPSLPLVFVGFSRSRKNKAEKTPSVRITLQYKNFSAARGLPTSPSLSLPPSKSLPSFPARGARSPKCGT